MTMPSNSRALTHSIRTQRRNERLMFAMMDDDSKLLAHQISSRWADQYPENNYQYTYWFRKRIESGIYKYGLPAAEQWGQSMIGYLGVKSSAEILMETISRQLLTQSEQSARVIVENLNRRVLAQLQTGDTKEEILRRIMIIVRDPVWLRRIARTETHGAMELGAYEAAQSLGLRMVKEWMSAEDGAVRPDHVAADGQLQEIDTPFQVGNEKMRFCGDPLASAKQKANCRCTTLYHLVENGKIIR